MTTRKRRPVARSSGRRIGAGQSRAARRESAGQRVVRGVRLRPALLLVLLVREQQDALGVGEARHRAGDLLHRVLHALQAVGALFASRRLELALGDAPSVTAAYQVDADVA